MTVSSPMTPFFKIIAKDKRSKARAGILKTPHGEIQTPVFVPVGTQGTVKSLTNDDLSNIGVQIFFANTYHLYLRPGADTIEKLGGLHKFTGWDKPLMTDSGGFQVFSLGSGEFDTEAAHQRFFRLPILPVNLASRETGRARKVALPRGTKFLRGRKGSTQKSGGRPISLLVKIDDDGATFRSHLDGSLHRFTPEISIEVQQKLGADIILSFDDCPSYGVEKEKVRKAMERTHQWALRSLKATQGKPLKLKQLIFGVVQGGVFKDLREESAKFISSLALSGVEGFDGLAIGGVAVGESKKEMYQVLDWVVPYLPDSKPRHLLGVGEVDDIFAAVERGIDMFDCVMPTRLGRMGHVLTQVKSQKLKVKGFTIDITKAVFKDDSRPIEEGCQCYTCQNFSRAYLNHLFRTRELLAYRLASFHNLYFMEKLFQKIREAIKKGDFLKLKKEWGLDKKC